MYRLILVFFLLLTACVNRPSIVPQVDASPSVTATTTSSPTTTVTETPIPTATFTPVPTFIPTSTFTPVPTFIPTPNENGSLNCFGSVALMYHRVLPEAPEIADGIGINSDLGSFERVLSYLVDNDYYFPTPSEFALDVENGVCLHKYAIIIIDDSWNDPEAMGVTKVLEMYGGGNADGSPKVWLAVITRMMAPFTTINGNQIASWVHLKQMREEGLVYSVSHSQTHPAGLINTSEVYDPVNDPVYSKIAGELGQSRQDILELTGEEPLFFVYPGGNVTQVISSRIKSNGYFGAFTVTPGSLNGAYANYLPRINGGYGCNRTVESNSQCVIGKIEEYTK